MPHTSRRKKVAAAAHTKREKVSLDDGWTQITYQGVGRRFGRSMTTLDPVPPQDRELSIEKLQNEFDHMTTKWTQSECRRSLLAILQRQFGDQKSKVTEAVCLALGSVSREQRTRKDSLWQLVTFMDIANMLKTMNGHTINLFAQEPRFTELDRSFLNIMGCIVLESPEAKSHVGSETFLFVPHLEFPAENPYRQRATHCPLYITNRLEWVIEEAERLLLAVDIQEVVQTSREAVDQARAILRSHKGVDFPECELSDALTMTIYVQQHAQED